MSKEITGNMEDPLYLRVLDPCHYLADNTGNPP